MLSEYGLDDEEGLLDALTRARLAAEKDIPTGTAGPMRALKTPIPDSVEPSPTDAPIVDLRAARLSDAEAGLQRGVEQASREAISGLAMAPPPTAASLVSTPGNAEARALAAQKSKADSARQQRLDALRALQLEAEGSKLEESKRHNQAMEEEAKSKRETVDANADADRAAKEAAAKAKLSRTGAGAAGKKEAKAFKDSSSLRKEFNGLPEVKNFKEASTSLSKIRNAAKNVSAAGDLSLVFAYMKVLDPASTVREGEFQAAAAAAGADQRLLGALERVRSGQLLTPEQRNDFVKQAEVLHAAQKEQYARTASQFRDLATKAGLSPDDVTGTQEDGGAAVDDERSKALAWAKANPNDPRSAAILKKLGVAP